MSMFPSPDQCVDHWKHDSHTILYTSGLQLVISGINIWVYIFKNTYIFKMLMVKCMRVKIMHSRKDIYIFILSLLQVYPSGQYFSCIGDRHEKKELDLDIMDRLDGSQMQQPSSLTAISAPLGLGN